MYNGIKTIDELIMRIFKVVRKKVIGVRRTVLYSREKVKRRDTILFWKAKIRKLKGKVVDEEVMKKCKEIHHIESSDNKTLKEAIEALNKVKIEWKEIKIKGIEYRKKQLLDYYYSEVVAESDKQKKQK